jgi:hypothetical protein
LIESVSLWRRWAGRRRWPREWNEARVQFAVIFSERFVGQ